LISAPIYPNDKTEVYKMKNNRMFKNKIICSVTVCIITALSVFSAFAADAITINSESFSVGDTITYNADLKLNSDCSGINAVLTYDSDSLELDESSLNVPNLGQTIANSSERGTVKFVAIDVENGFDFKEEKLLISATFKIKDNATSNNIGLEIEEIYDTELQEIDMESCLLKETVKKGEYEGDIVNPVDGIEAMSENDGATVPVVSNDTSNYTDNTNQTAVVWVFVGIAAAVVILAVVAFVYRNKKLEQNNSLILSDEDSTEGDKE